MPQVSLDELTTKVSDGSHLASFPTDTVPALVTRPDQAALIFTAKQRSFDKPLILMAAAVIDLWDYVRGSAAEWHQWELVVNQYLPGALTLVLPASDRVPFIMNSHDPTTIGVRVPNHAIAQAILTQTGPLATTSANFSGQPPLQLMTEIEAQFPTALTLSPDEIQQIEGTQPPTVSGVPSTVIRWRDMGWEILRQGAIDLHSSSHKD
ncbi:L-threonylcarbamoyladenylate synthase [Phormidium sp. CLA17]|uniref:L-threonylcarbamoyladenylate synthase n=1 Tax=Leptolyngbya sp. Cla-17 TaxID=2803751 RepID=UPI001491E566|nr:L-threonylcarbamoyladenylate synthase [Leptolyngbya sp. Cla-17]MBM0743750.1 L-threonylcarbamoyladenylate synthase [Leptolyngbya sp. Cla-17]